MVRSTSGRLAAAAVAGHRDAGMCRGRRRTVTGMVQGQGDGRAGQPVADAKVTIVQKGAEPGARSKTGKKGDFVQMGLHPGAYKVTAEKENLGAHARDATSIWAMPRTS